MKNNCDRCKHRNSCDGKKWCRGFKDYKKGRRNEMSEQKQKRYTAQKIREVADMFNSATNPIAVCSYDKDVWSPNYIECHVERMLRQAADAEEEREANEKVKWSTDKSARDERDNLIYERDELKARLEAVVKECNGVKWDEKIYVTIDTSTAAVDHNKDIDTILRAARGEGGAE